MSTRACIFVTLALYGVGPKGNSVADLTGSGIRWERTAVLDFELFLVCNCGGFWFHYVYPLYTTQYTYILKENDFV